MSGAQAAHVLVLEHAPQEGPYALASALEAAGLPVRVCRTWAGEEVPDTLADAVALVVMGGPMVAYEDFPGRAAEPALLRAALEAEVPVLGVCLGAQLLASAAGGTVRAGDGAQIGWGEVRVSPAAHTDPLFAEAPERLHALHWHSDTVELPSGATLLASCDRYPVQAFRDCTRDNARLTWAAAAAGPCRRDVPRWVTRASSSARISPWRC
ncbi:type 1 glutamine amidotransferase [Streptomyces actinomycinicus]|uniref:type 1 glutamine amidotransferase n=1 Tax=Streptomyces actinomycinicus TaxID=1695166 RepID=UPI0027DA9329|nr:type 1 glutamine amidotransferase [Streptomyces actinomycinicus]